VSVRNVLNWLRRRSRLVNVIIEKCYANKTLERNVLFKYEELFRLVTRSRNRYVTYCHVKVIRKAYVEILALLGLLIKKTFLFIKTSRKISFVLIFHIY